MPIPGADNQLYFATGIDNTGLMRGKAQAMGIIGGMASQISRTDVFAGLAIGATIAFGKISKEMKEFSTEFEHSMKEVQTISAAVQQDFGGFSDAVIDLSTDVPQTARELSEALYQIVSAGYDGAAGMELLEISAHAAVGGVTDVETAADGLTTVMNAWKISAENATKVSDIFFNTVKLGKTTMGELASNIAQVASLAAAHKVGVEQIFSATASLTKQGTTTSMAMTQLRAALIAVNEKLGQGWSKSMTFQEALVEISNRAKEAGEDLKTFVGGRVEAVIGILALTGENAAGASEDLKSYADALGMSEEAFRTMIEDSVNQSKILKNNLKAALKPLGDFLSGKSTEFAKKLNEAFESGEIKEFTKYIGIATAALVAYNLTADGAALSTRLLKKAMSVSILAMRGLKTALATNPFGIVLIGLTAAATALYAFKKASDEVGKVTGKFHEAIGKDIFSLNSLFESLKSAKKGTDEWNTARETINTRYGKYLDNLIDEKTSLEEIELAQKRVTAAMIANAGIKIYQEQLNREMDQFQKKFNSTMGKFTEVFSEFKGADRLPEFIMAINEGIDEAIKQGGGQIERGMLEYSTIAKEIYDRFIYDISQQTGFIKWDPASFTEGFLDLAEFKAKEATFTDYLQGMIKSFQKMIGEISINPDEGDGTDDPGKEKLDKLKKDIEAAEKAYQEWEAFKETTQADSLKSEYQQYLDLGDTYKEYLGEQLKAYDGNAGAMAIIRKELAGVEIKEIEAAKKNMEAFADWADNLMVQILNDFDEFIDQKIQYEKDAENKAFKDRETKVLEAEKAIENIKLKYASRKEVYKKELAELDKFYKQARLPKDEEYYRLKNEIMKRFVADEIGEISRGINEIGGALVKFLQQIDEEAAETVEHIAGLFDGVAKAIKSYYSGDVVGFVSRIIGALTEIAALINEAAEKEMAQNTWLAEKAYERLNDELNKSNVLLQEQIKLLETYNGISWVNTATASMAELEIQMQDALAAMKEYTLFRPSEPGRSFKTPYDTSAWTADDFRQFLLDNPRMSMYEDEIQAYLDAYYAYFDQLQGLIDEVDAKLTGTSSDVITDSLVDAFRNGKIAAEDFAQTFEDLMKEAILQSFKTQFLEEQISGWYDLFVQSLEVPTSPSQQFWDIAYERFSPEEFAALKAKYEQDYGDLTQDEMDSLQAAWDAIIQQAQTGFDALSEGLDLDWGFGEEEEEDPNSLAGAIRRNITEETGSLIAGLMNHMMLSSAETAENTAQANDQLNQVIYNTSFNHHLEGIHSSINEMRDALTE